MLFNLKGSAHLRSMNITRGTSEEPNSNVVLKIEVESVSPETICAALGMNDVQDLLNGFFRLDGDEKAGKLRSVRFPGAGWTQADGKWDDRHVLTVDGDDDQHRCARVGNIRFKPMPGEVFTISANVRVEDPTGDLLETLSQHLNSTIPLDLVHDPELELEHHRQETENAERQREEVTQGELGKAA